MKPKLNMETTITRLQGEFYVMNLANRLLYEGFEFGDEISVKIRLVKRNRTRKERRAEAQATIEQLAVAGNTIDAIKLYRNQTGASLKDAVDHVRELQKKLVNLK